MSEVARLMGLARYMARRETGKHGIDYDGVLSDALLGLAKAHARCEPGRPLAPYARRLMEGEVLHGKRDGAGRYRQAPRFEIMLDDQVGVMASDPRPGPLEQVEARELWQWVDRTLSPRDRLVVRLSYQWDLTQTEIAGVIGCSQMHVSRILRAAVAQLRAAA